MRQFTGHLKERERTEHPLIKEYNQRLGSLVGVLSRFIIDRAYNRSTMRGTLTLDSERSLEMIENIDNEAEVLVGPLRAKRLKQDLIKITKDFYEEDG
ncbi:MAG: hypothetical protein ACMUIE_08765 [Thermoplasmatota archaeon]